ncbi:hypothetical protein [uncultured Roseibium sp.]|uniref:hypothetical protein n=1 Tax=uncultured Roseibium sp. TaxID=1936171 RepID=UPI002603CEE2|nr:hypothetical protein [uncultured Roseibium sp.]
MKRLLSAHGVEARGLAPKPFGVFLLPYAIVPGRVIYLTEMEAIALPAHWKSTASRHWRSIENDVCGFHKFSRCISGFQKIRFAIDRLVEPSRRHDATKRWQVA